MSVQTKRICIGKITTAHGVRGLVKVQVFGSDDDVIDQFGPLYTGETGDKTLTLRRKHVAGGVLVAEVKDVTDRNTAETLRGTELWLDCSALPELEGEFYQADLIGLKVIDPANVEIGTVLSVQNFGAGDLLEIHPLAGKSFFLPFTDDYVPDVDLDAGTVTVDIPEGWLEE
jgi:16S rRNA processing protein RimM